MGLASAGVQLVSLPPNGFRNSKLSLIKRPFQPQFRFQSTFASSLIKCNINLWKNTTKARNSKVSSSLQQVEEDVDDEACELVNGIELSIGEGDDTIPAYLFKAVKNNNGTGILLLSDLFGFEDSSTREFAYRVACNGFNVLLPDLFRGDPWTKKQPETILEQSAKQDLQRITKDIETATKWLVDEFLAAGISKKLGLMGFGYGGGRVIDVLARDQGACFSMGTSFYGTNINPSLGPKVKVPVLLISGDNDPLCPVSVLKELEKGIAQGSKLIIFEGRDHGFVHKPGSPEEDKDAEQAFLMLRNWLHDGLVVNI